MHRFLAARAKELKYSFQAVSLLAAFASVLFGGSITSVSTISTDEIQTITISGSGFGTQSPYTGNSSLIILDVTENWAAGFVGPCPVELNGCEGRSYVTNAVTLVVNSWQDSSLTIGGFSGAWGAPNPDKTGTTWTVLPDDELQVYIWNPQTGAFAGSITTTADPPDAPEPGTLALAVFGGAAIVGTARFRRRRRGEF